MGLPGEPVGGRRLGIRPRGEAASVPVPSLHSRGLLLRGLGLQRGRRPLHDRGRLWLWQQRLQQRRR